ncbi:MAG: hypothetical protein ACRERD_21990, partial [Candidatus Binatia bacterium]
MTGLRVGVVGLLKTAWSLLPRLFSCSSRWVLPTALLLPLFLAAPTQQSAVADQGEKSRTAETVFSRTAISQATEAAYGKLPLHFEANHGQVDRQVQYLARGQGYS